MAHNPNREGREESKERTNLITKEAKGGPKSELGRTRRKQRAYKPNHKRSEE